MYFHNEITKERKEKVRVPSFLFQKSIQQHNGIRSLDHILFDHIIRYKGYRQNKSFCTTTENDQIKYNILQVKMNGRRIF